MSVSYTHLGIDTAVNGIQTAVEKMTALSSKIDADQIANFSDSMTAYTTGVSDTLLQLASILKV